MYSSISGVIINASLPNPLIELEPAEQALPKVCVCEATLLTHLDPLHSPEHPCLVCSALSEGSDPV